MFYAASWVKKVINPETKEVNTLALKKALRDYKEVFALPGMKMVERDLNNARTAQILLNKARCDIKVAGYDIDRDASQIYGKLTPTGVAEPLQKDVPGRLKMKEGATIQGKTALDIDAMRVFLPNPENPTTSIIQIRSLDNPQQNFEALIGFAKRGPKDLGGDPVEGLKQVVIDAAVESSRRTDGTIDMVKFREFLLNPMTTSNSQSLVEVLKKQRHPDKR